MYIILIACLGFLLAVPFYQSETSIVYSRDELYLSQELCQEDCSRRNYCWQYPNPYYLLLQHNAKLGGGGWVRDSLPVWQYAFVLVPLIATLLSYMITIVEACCMCISCSNLNQTAANTPGHTPIEVGRFVKMLRNLVLMILCLSTEECWTQASDETSSSTQSSNGRAISVAMPAKNKYTMQDGHRLYRTRFECLRDCSFRNYRFNHCYQSSIYQLTSNHKDGHSAWVCEPLSVLQVCLVLTPLFLIFSFLPNWLVMWFCRRGQGGPEDNSESVGTPDSD